MPSLTLNLRALLKKPLGKIIRGAKAISLAKSQKSFAVVGDSTLYFFLRNRLKPRLSIFDFHVQRKEAPKTLKALISKNFPLAKKIKNKAGSITKKAISEIEKLSGKNKTTAIQILGEEDLLTLPAIKYAPANSYVFYGQPKKGIVAVLADKMMKKKAGRIMKKMR